MEYVYDELDRVSQVWYTENGKVAANMLSFTYNADGIRTSKTVNGVKHTYLLSGSTIMAEYWQARDATLNRYVQYLLIYLYDANGSPVGMMYRDSTMAADTYDYFLFEKNLQGDIVAVYNASGTKLLSYTYDAWGNCTVSGSTTTGAQYNPFRYRGYYYDSELGLYYLNSRYYDAGTGRFISVDAFSVTFATPAGLTDKNLLAYCDNNPVSRVDFGGQMWQSVPALDPRVQAYKSGSSIPYTHNYDSSAYNTYRIKTQTSYYDSKLYGFYEKFYSVVLSQFVVPGATTVTDSMAVNHSQSSQAKSSTTTLYRSVSIEEAMDIQATGKFNLVAGAMECKQFGFDLFETKEFGNLYNQSIIVSAKLPTDMLDRFYRGGVDRTIFRAGTLTVDGDLLDIFNQAISGTIDFLP